MRNLQNEISETFNQNAEQIIQQAKKRKQKRLFSQLLRRKKEDLKPEDPPFDDGFPKD